MNMQEYLKVKDMTYLEYCDYLQNKYGIGLADYMTKSYSINAKCKRTKDGLVAHHKAEDKMILLSTREIAMQFPLEWQSKENIVYCDYLEHLLLHVLICKYPSPDKVPEADVGIGGVINFIVPELNDLYSGWETNQAWRKNLHDKVINDKEVYLAILKQFIDDVAKDRELPKDKLYTSYNEPFGLWSRKQNTVLYRTIDKLW